MENFERRLIVRALAQAHWSQRHAARELGVLPTTLNAKMKRLGIPSQPPAGRLAPTESQRPDPVVSAEADDESREEFRWSGCLSVGRTLEIVGVNRHLRVEAARVDEVSILAVTSGPRPQRRQVTVRVMPTRWGMRLVAESLSGRPPATDVQVDAWVRTPVGVRLIGRVGQGHLESFGIPGRFELRAMAAPETVVFFAQSGPQDPAAPRFARLDGSQEVSGIAAGLLSVKPST